MFIVQEKYFLVKENKCCCKLYITLSNQDDGKCFNFVYLSVKQI